MHDLESTPLVRGAMATLESILSKMENREIQIKLKELQKAAGRGEGHLPVKPVDTRFSTPNRTFTFIPIYSPRWSSKVFSMEGALSIQDFIKIAIPDAPGSADWGLMAKCVERLRPIADATAQVESDTATLLTVTRCILPNMSPILYSLFRSQVAALKTHWSNQDDFHTFNVPALQALDPTSSSFHVFIMEHACK